MMSDLILTFHNSEIQAERRENADLYHISSSRLTDWRTLIYHSRSFPNWSLQQWSLSLTRLFHTVKSSTWLVWKSMDSWIWRREWRVIRPELLKGSDNGMFPDVTPLDLSDHLSLSHWPVHVTRWNRQNRSRTRLKKKKNRICWCSLIICVCFSRWVPPSLPPPTPLSRWGTIALQARWGWVEGCGGGCVSQPEVDFNYQSV